MRQNESLALWDHKRLKDIKQKIETFSRKLSPRQKSMPIFDEKKEPSVDENYSNTTDY